MGFAPLNPSYDIYYDIYDIYDIRVASGCQGSQRGNAPDAR